LLLLALSAAPAWADDDKPAAADPAGANPAAQTLPATASATAQANAFGQQGARMLAAHQAARAAAAQEAHKAAAQGPAVGAVRPRASAQTHASTAGVSHGFDRAAAGAANGPGAARRPR
jgi:hypothetical protein